MDSGPVRGGLIAGAQFRAGVANGVRRQPGWRKVLAQHGRTPLPFVALETPGICVYVESVAWYVPIAVLLPRGAHCLALARKSQRLQGILMPLRVTPRRKSIVVFGTQRHVYA